VVSRVLVIKIVIAVIVFFDVPVIAEDAEDVSRINLSKETYAYKKVGDCVIKADVYRLPGDNVRPVIIWIHGGALIFSNRESVRDHQLKKYLDSGYTVVSIDYRLAPETKLSAIIEDLQDAYQWVRERGPQMYKIDPERVAVVGHSAGGYLALMAGFRVNPRPKALVSFYGYGDITGNWYTRPDPHYLQWDRVNQEDAYKAVGSRVLSESEIFPRVIFYNYCRQKGLWPKEVTGLDPDKEPQKFNLLCPIRNITKQYPPTLLLHGDKDIDVPFEESERMATELKRHEVVHYFIPMKNYNHLFDVFPEGFPSDEPPKELKDPRVLAAFDEVLAFLKKHL
jgi:acetyl esterase/lipase